jgi:hypothetical protein
MIDLDSQLRDYIDGIAAPVPSPAQQVVIEPTSFRGHARRRRTIAALLVAIVAFGAVALFLALDRGSGSAPPKVTPAKQPPAALPLTVQSSADCSAVLQPGQAVLLSAVVNRGHAICVIRDGDSYTTYFDGHVSMSGGLPPSGSDGSSGQFGGIATDDSRSFAFGNYSPTAGSARSEGVRISFCDGLTVDAPPLTSTAPYFFGVEYADELGSPQDAVPLIDGKPQGRAFGQCPPPETSPRQPSRAARNSIALTPLGATDCSTLEQPGDSIVVATTTEGSHQICAFDNGTRSNGFVDGQLAYTQTRTTTGGTGQSGGGVANPDGRTLYLVALRDDADSQQVIFCDGSRLTLRPLNETTPRFVAAILDESDGIPSTKMIKNREPSGGETNTCPPRTPRAKRK